MPQPPALRLAPRLPLQPSPSRWVALALALLAVPTAALAQGPQPAPGGAATAPAAPTTGTPTDGTPVEAAPRPLRPNARVSFNLEDAELNELVKMVSEITGRRFIIPGKARSLKATVYAPRDVTAAEVYRAFLTILELNGMTVAQAGPYWKIIDTAGAESQNLPMTLQDGDVPADERYVTHLHRADHLGAQEAMDLLSRFKSKDGNVSAHAPSNMLILTDTGANIRRMLRILQAVDVARTGEQLWIEPVHYANANDLANTIQQIFPAEDGGDAKGGNKRSSSSDSGSDGAAASGGTVGLSKILADQRTNSLIILASDKAYMRVLELIRRFDVPLEGGGRMRVHQLQNSDAEEVATTLEGLISGNTSAPSGGRRQPNNNNADNNAKGGGDIFEGQVRVTAHKPSNALVITSSVHDYATLRQVIDQLDMRRRQVFIEAVVMELSTDANREVGVSYHGGIPNVPTDGSLGIVGFNAQNTLAPASALTSGNVLQGVAAGVTGPLVENSQQLFGVSIPSFGVLINALATSGNTNVLATPHIIALDNKKAEISVGQNIPLQTSGIPPGTFGGLGAAAGLAGAQGQNPAASGFAGGLTGAVPRQDVGTTVRITPHISDEDSIRLEIQEEISQALPATGTLGVVPIGQRRASTEVVVGDQQTVVIGGLLREVESSSERKIPVLGDIPLLGFLFRTRTKRREKTNLLLILTPYIIRTPADLRAIFERKMRERQEYIDRYFVFTDSDYQPPIDYSRTRGLVAEIFGEIDALREEHRLIEEAERAKPREHKPSAPVAFEPPAADATVVTPSSDQAGAPAP